MYIKPVFDTRAFIFTSTVYQTTSGMSQCTSRQAVSVPNHLYVCRGAQVCTHQVYEASSEMSQCMSRQAVSAANHLYVCQGAQMCIRRVYEATSGMSQCMSRQVFRVPNHLFVCKGGKRTKKKKVRTTTQDDVDAGRAWVASNMSGTDTQGKTAMLGAGDSTRRGHRGGVMGITPSGTLCAILSTGRHYQVAQDHVLG